MNNPAHRNTVFRFWESVRQRLINLIKDPAFYVYLISIVIYLPWLLPNLSDIAPWDETYYIISGRGILSGQLSSLAQAPLLSFFYLFCYLPFINSPFWLIHANTLGRFLLFSLLFIGAWQVGRSLKDHFNPIIMFGFLFLSPILTQNFEYPADIMFAAASALAFAHAVNFLKSHNIRHVWYASFWLGLGMLTRGDAMIIIAVLLIFVLWVGWKDHQWWRLLMALLIPFLGLSIGYVLVRGVITGDFETGMANRSYVAFEQGQEVDMPQTAGRFAAPTESYYVARELFGTPEENEHSVLRAIQRNPQAYLRRLWAVLQTLPGLFLTAYYRRYTIFLSLLAIRGSIVLIKQKKIPLLLLHLIWVLPLSAGIARTLVRVGYFRIFYFVMFSLAIIGLQAVLENLRTSWEGILWAGLLIFVLILTFHYDDPAIRFGMTVFLAWLTLSFLLSQPSAAYPNWHYMSMLLLLASGILLTGTFILLTPRELGIEPRERASLALRDVTHPEDNVLTCVPSVVFLAERQVANFCSANIPEFETSEQFISWMAIQDFRAVYLERSGPAVLWDLTFDQEGRALSRVYSSEGDEVHIFLLDQER